MKPKKLLTALLAALVLLTFAAPFTQALESAPFAVMQGASTQFVLFGKFKNDGTTDRNTIYSNFTNVTIANTGIAEAYQRGSQWYVIGKANDASSSFTATLANGETVTGTIVSFKKWTSQSRGGSGGAGISSTTRYVGINSTLTLSIVGTGKGVTEYDWSVDNSSLGSVVNGVFTSSGTLGPVTVTAKDKTSGQSFSFQIRIVSPNEFEFSPASLNMTVGQSASVTASFYLPSGARSSTWTSDITGIATVSGSGVTATVTGVSVGTTTIRYSDTNGASGFFTVTVTNRTFSLSASRYYLDSYYTGGYVSVSGLSASDLRWSSSNYNVLTVDSSGYYRRVGYGYGSYYRITATDPVTNTSRSVDIQVY